MGTSLRFDKEGIDKAAIVLSEWSLPMPFRPDDLVDDIMRSAPHTIRVFLEFRMACVGCPIGCFHTVDDACREHGIDRAKFLAALCESVPA
jgi:hybrid cluster-associated redox disulfide protein